MTVPEVQTSAGCGASQGNGAVLVGTIPFFPAWDLSCETSCSVASLALAWHVAGLWLTCRGHGPV